MYDIGFSGFGFVGTLKTSYSQARTDHQPNSREPMSLGVCCEIALNPEDKELEVWEPWAQMDNARSQPINPSSS